MGKGGLGTVMGVSLVLASCSSAPTRDAPVQTPVASAPASEEIDYAAASQPIGTRMPQIDGDLCHAAELQSLVGQPRTEIPVPVDVINRRVTCTTCPVTEDYSPYRLNIFYDQDTGIVEEVRCG